MNDNPLMRYNEAATPEERRARSQAAGRKSAEVRARKKTFAEAGRLLLQGKLDAEHAAAIKQQFDLDGSPEELTHYEAIMAALTTKAEGGDRDAAAFVRDTIGESPAQLVKLGNLDDKPFETLDLAALSDEELRRIAERERPTSGN